MQSVTAGILKNQTVISLHVYITIVTQCDWSWYLDVGSSLITCYNKSTRTAVYQYDSAHCIQQRRHITYTDWLCIVGRNYNKNQNFCGDESISREIGPTQKRNLVKSGQHKTEISWNRVKTKTKSREIESTQKRNLVKSGQHREIGSTHKRGLVKSGQHINEIFRNLSLRDFRFIIQCLCSSRSVATAAATAECSRSRQPRHSIHIQTPAAIATAVWCSTHRPYMSAIYG